MASFQLLQITSQRTSRLPLRSSCRANRPRPCDYFSDSIACQPSGRRLRPAVLLPAKWRRCALVRQSLALLGIEGGIEITSVADIPARGTGLGSSSSFTVGLLNALHAYSGRYANAARLAEESCQVEIERCSEPIGKQDQYAAAFGGFNFIRFHPDDSVEVKKVLCAPSLVADLQSRLLFFYTGVTRSASTLLRQQSADVAAPGPQSDATGELVRLAEAAFADLCAGNVSSL